MVQMFTAFLKLWLCISGFHIQGPQCFQRQGIENALGELYAKIPKGT